MDLVNSPAMEFRRAWLEHVAGKCQTLIGSVMTMDATDELAPLLLEWTDALPDPTCAAEDLALRGLLFHCALRCGVAVHAHVHHGSMDGRCGFAATYAIDRFAGQGAAKASFQEWAQAFSAELARRHPVSAARRALAIIRAHDRDCDVAHLTTLVGVSPAHLRRTFRREFGISLPEYVRRIRLLRALEVLAGGGIKIEALALDVGYRSKKSFYQAFRRLTGLTPAAFRLLPAYRARQIVETTRAGLFESHSSMSSARGPTRKSA